MIVLIYASSATRDLTQADLLNILEAAHANNKKLDITGMLLYRNNNFLQVLEGEEETVDQVYEKIQQDGAFPEASYRTFSLI